MRVFTGRHRFLLYGVASDRFEAENCVTHYLGRCGTRHCILFDNCQTEVIELVECELYMFKIDSICPLIYIYSCTSKQTDTIAIILKNFAAM